MKIIELRAENIKRLVAVDIKPDGNVVQITGKNGQGKTSVLDSIWWALGGGAAIQAEPIRQGESVAKIMLDLGDLKVARVFKKDKEGETTSTLFVENKEGVRFTSPQAVLDKVLGKLTFDPLEFSRMSPKEQFDTLKTLVPGFDFDKAESENASDFSSRTSLNRAAKEHQTLADSIEVGTVRSELVDEVSIIREFERADKHNRETTARKLKRDEALRTIEKNKAEARRLLEQAAELEVEIEDAGELPPLTDVTAVMRRLEVAKKENADFKKAQEKAAHEKSAAALKAEAEACTARMEAREEAKRKAVAEAKLPVEGISFEEGEVLLKGVPFEQGSDAEKLRASVAIAMALNPTLKVVRIRDGSLLDSSSMDIVAKMAEERDCQVWIEKVDETGAVGFVIEEGRLAEKKPASA